MIAYLKDVTTINVTNQKKFFENKKQRSKYDKNMPYFLWKSIQDQFNYQGDLNYLNFLDFCNTKGISIYKSTVNLKCSFCGDLFELKILKPIIYILNRKYAKEYASCKNEKCQSKLRSTINKIQTESGNASGLGPHNMPDYWYESHKKGCKRAGVKRKGKTIDELYGKNVADDVRRKMSEKNKKYVEKHGHGPHIQKHSSKTRKKMSQKKKEFFKEEAYNKKYPNPYNENELVDWFTYNSLSSKYYHENLTEEERKERSIKTIETLNNKYDFNKHPNWGYHTPWWREHYSEYVDYIYDEAYQSKLELNYYKILDKYNVFYQNNKSIYLPYIHPKDNKTHYYVPDLLIFEDYRFNKIIEIIEIKPYEFAYNPNQRDGEYYEITKRKLCTLRMHCLTNNIKYTIITEKEVYKNEGK